MATVAGRSHFKLKRNTKQINLGNSYGIKGASIFPLVYWRQKTPRQSKGIKTRLIPTSVTFKKLNFWISAYSMCGCTLHKGKPVLPAVGYHLCSKGRVYYLLSGAHQCPLFGVERCLLLGGLKCISSMVKSIGGKWSVRCTEVVRFSEGLLLEVLL